MIKKRGLNEETWRAISFSDGSGWAEPWWTWRRLSGVLQGLFASLREQNRKITAAFIHFGVMDFYLFFCLFLKSKRKKRKRVKLDSCSCSDGILFPSPVVFLSISQTPVFMYSYLKKKKKLFPSTKQQKTKNCKYYSYCMFSNVQDH